MTPLTASEWLKTNYPHATGWHEEYATEYADYYTSFPKWIDVNDRLPEVENWILVASEYNEMPILAHIDIYGTWWGIGGYIVKYVTHWQPLPELPKTEQICKNNE